MRLLSCMEESARVIISINDIMAMSPFETTNPSGKPPTPKTKTRADNIINELLLRRLTTTPESRLTKLLKVIESKSYGSLLSILVQPTKTANLA